MLKASFFLDLADKSLLTDLELLVQFESDNKKTSISPTDPLPLQTNALSY